MTLAEELPAGRLIGAPADLLPPLELLPSSEAWLGFLAFFMADFLTAAFFGAAFIAFAIAGKLQQLKERSSYEFFDASKHENGCEA
jgi:hypothetical protein